MVFSSHRGSIASTVEAAKTAPVHEFRCLYTHDLRRKQKRWQDGFLKFHTFNKRVMVYDQPRNYIGDTHWKDGDTLVEGDELALENGVIVQVGEAVATTETDLTPILQKKKPREPATLATPIRSNLPTPGVRSSGLRIPSQRPLHRPLTALLGTPKGAQGRAMVPVKSPFEERRAKMDQENEWASERAAKRLKVAEAGQARHAVVAAETPRPKARNLMGVGTSNARGQAAQKTPLAQRTANGIFASTGGPVELIDITSDNDDNYSDVTLPETPPTFKRLPPVRNPVKTKPAPKVAPKPSEAPPPASPPVSTTSKVVNVQKETELVEQAVKGAEPPARQSPPRKTLKLAKVTKRKMLMCQLDPPVNKHSKPSMQPGNIGCERSNPVPNPKETTTTSGMRRLHNGFTSSPLSESNEQSEERDDAIDQRPEKPRTRTLPWLDKDREAHPTSENALQSHGVADKSAGTTANTSNHIPPSPKRPAPPNPERPTSPRTFRRIRSENDTVGTRTHEEPIVLDDDDDDVDAPIPAPVPARRSAAGAPAAAATNNPSKRTANTTTTTTTTKPRAPLHRTTSAIITASTALEWPRRGGGEGEGENENARTPSPPADADVGPWCSEAFDLFDWRPPGWAWLGQGRGFGVPDVVGVGEGVGVRDGDGKA